MDKRLRKETEDEWAVHKNHHEGASSVKRHLERKVKRMGMGSEGHGNLNGLNGKGMQKKLRRVKKATHLQLATRGFVDSSNVSNSIEKRGGGMFKGVSSYYLFALDDGPRRQVLDAIKGGGFTVVRIFLSGVGYNNKGSGNNAVPDREFLSILPFATLEADGGSERRSNIVEPDKVGEYDDTILYKIDKLMADCQDRGQFPSTSLFPFFLRSSLTLGRSVRLEIDDRIIGSLRPRVLVDQCLRRTTFHRRSSRKGETIVEEEERSCVLFG